MVKVKTNVLKELTGKAIKGAGFDSLLPLSSMMGVRVGDGKLCLLTTDMTNSLCVGADVDDKTAELDVTVDANVFFKLVSKLSLDETELEFKDGVLIVKANGVYKIPCIVDEEGFVSFPAQVGPHPDEMKGEIDVSKVRNVYHVNKSSLSKSLDNPIFTGYYVDKDVVISTDGKVITFNEVNLMNVDEPVIISPQIMSLMTLFSEDKIKYELKDGKIYLATDNMMLNGPTIDGVENYPIDQIKPYMSEEFKSSCNLNKGLVLSVLDRLALFIEPYDKNGADFIFTGEELLVKSIKESSVEKIKYLKKENVEDTSVVLEVFYLRDTIEAVPGDTVDIHFGHDKAVKLTSGNVSHVISLMLDTPAQEEVVEEETAEEEVAEEAVAE